MSGAASPRPLGRVLSAGHAAVYQDAHEALTQARRDAADLLAGARKQAEAEAATLVAEARRTAETEALGCLREAHERAAAQLDAARPLMAEVIGEAVARILGQPPAADTLTQAVQHAISSLLDRSALRVRVAPANVAGLRDRLGDVEVVADADLADDAAIVESGSGFVRAGLGSQLDALRSAMRP